VTHQVRRGGTWYRTLLSNGRSAYRSIWPSRELPDDFTGFRVVCLSKGAAPLRMLLRGGSWGFIPGGCRSAYRGRSQPGVPDDDIGFRVVSLPREVAP
jgi:formylglycine-generating enzyme required for sulfatase activity